MSDIAEQIGRAIREACEAREWSLSQLARNADIATPTVLDIASGNRVPRIETLDKLVRALGSDEMLEAILNQIRSSASDADSGCK